MSDEALRALERRFKQTGDRADEEAWFRERERTGELSWRFEALRAQLAEAVADGFVMDDGVELRRFPRGPGDAPFDRVQAGLEAVGFPALMRPPRELDRDEASRYLRWRFARTQAYSETILPPEAVDPFVDELLALLPSYALFFTNVGAGWSQQSMSWSRGLTNHTFDDGLLALADEHVVLAWFADED